MPDGDIVHSKLPGIYQKSYQWLCEGKANIKECARTVIKALKRDLRRKGDLPVRLAKRMEESVERAINDAGENDSVDWTALSQEIDTLARQVDGRPDLKELTLSAARSVLHNLRYGQDIDTDNTTEVILQRYMYEVYKSDFKERTPLSKHHAGIDEVTLNKRIEQIQPDILTAISKWAKKATEDQYVVPHGNRPAKDPSLHLLNMLVQVCTFRRLLSTSDQWEALTREFLELDNIVDRSAAAENLLPADMQSRLIKLYQTYVAEWDAVEARIAAEILDQDRNQQASSELSLQKVEGVLP